MISEGEKEKGEGVALSLTWFLFENLGPPLLGQPFLDCPYSAACNRHVYTDELAAELAVAERDACRR